MDPEPIPKIVIHRCSTSTTTKTIESGDSNSRSNSTSELEGKLENRKEMIDEPKNIHTSGNDCQSIHKQLSGRMKSLKMINNCMAEHIKSEETKSNWEESNKKGQMNSENWENRKMTMYHKLARFNEKFGIRHFLLIGLLVIYALLGGLTFQTIEKEHEYKHLKKNMEALEMMIEHMTRNLTTLLQVKPSQKLQKDIKLMIAEYYQTMLKIEGKYIGSVFHKYEHIAVSLSWYFGSSVFYAMTLFTTIGYGTIVCHTTLGKIVSIIYALFGIPLMLVVLSDVGQLMLRFFTFCHNSIRDNFRSWLRWLAFRILAMEEDEMTIATAKQRSLSIKNGSVHPMRELKCKSIECADIESINEEKVGDENAQEDFRGGFPLHLSVPIVFFYLVFISTLISFFDWPDPDSNDNNGPGLTFCEAFYFSFISLTTIGLGDLMPNNGIEFSPFLAILFLIGLALLSVVNSSIYLRIEGCFLWAVDYLEEYLEATEYRQDGHHCQEGYFVFKSLAPNIQLLALAMPIFPDEKEDQIEAMLEPKNTVLGRRMFSVTPTATPIPLPRRNSPRTFSTSADDDTRDQSGSSHHQYYHTVQGSGSAGYFFRPTLGILNTAPLSRKGTIERKPSGLSRTSVAESDYTPTRRKRAITVGHFGTIDERGEMDRGMRRRTGGSSMRRRKLKNSMETRKDETSPERPDERKKTEEREAKPEKPDARNVVEERKEAGKGQPGTTEIEGRLYSKRGDRPGASASNKLRRVQSERVREPGQQPDGRGELYVIDECEQQQPQLATVSGGERAQSPSQRRMQRLGKLGQRTFIDHTNNDREQ